MIEKINFRDFDIITPINYAGHKLYKQAIDLLHSSGEEYLEYLKAKSYNKDEYGDIDGAIYRGLWYSRKANVNIADKNIDVPYVDIDIPDEILPQYNDGEKKYIKNPIAKNIIDSIIENIISNDFNHHEL